MRQWKIEVNDRYCSFVDLLLGLSTGALVLPAVFLRQFKAIPATIPLEAALTASAYAAVAFFATAILLGIVFRYTSIKWIKNAWDQPTMLGEQWLERILDWTFWLMVVAFAGGVASMLVFAR